MTKEEAKEIQIQIDALQAQLKEYKKDERAKEILQKEEEYVGRMYKKKGDIPTYKDNKSIEPPDVYLRVVSAITPTSNEVWCLEFEPFTKPKFLHGTEFSVFRNVSGPYDYLFDDEPMIFMEKETIEDLSTYEEIYVDNFVDKLSKFCTGIIDFAKSSYTMEEYFGGHYVEEIRSQAAKEDKE